ncbi:hypothetical protein HYC85_008008 [Camellia sinensis]|uniref:Pentacotripeptide-repeat region of PRORP domain-containing protein n=1 Tax=Camellia sinensis TaxID=4442 RepID=A0A7J7HQK1_CAMSI|nr:hypothetical protein HYC85_008008 [Camellia sinensis]
MDPGIEHYSCMVDLYARIGCLKEAMNLIEQMPFEADRCIAPGNKSLGKKVAELITDLDPDNSGACVQLSSIFETSGEWEKSEQIRKLMRDKRIQKNLSFSWAKS